MLKTLIKKQLLALSAAVTMDRKHGKKRSKGAVAGFCVLFIFMFISLCMAFLGMSEAIEMATLPGRAWLYMTLMGMIALVLSIIGSVFSTYATIYKAKDNELMLSLPVPPANLLISKVFSVYLTALLFSAIVMIPALINYWTSGLASAASAVYGILTIFLIALISTALSCILGWLVALVIGLFPNKNAVSVIATLVFLGAYYFFYFRINTILRSMAANIDVIDAKLSGSGIAMPVIAMGRGAAGDTASFLIFAAICIVLFAAVLLVLSKTFIRIATKTEKHRTKTYVATRANMVSPKAALLKKEFRRLFGSPVYLLNTALASFIMIIGAVVLLIYAKTVRGALGSLAELGLDFIQGYIPLIAAAALCFICTMNYITAPSISLEAKTLWLIKSVPTDAGSIFYAKKRLHEIMTLVPALILLVAAAVVLQMSFADAAAVAVLVVLFVMFTAAAGLAINLKMPNLTWTNETVAVKQSGSIFLAMFGGWIFVLALAGAFFLVRSFIAPMTYIYILCALLLVLTLLVDLWIGKRGAKILESL